MDRGIDWRRLHEKACQCENWRKAMDLYNCFRSIFEQTDPVSTGMNPEAHKEDPLYQALGNTEVQKEWKKQIETRRMDPRLYLRLSKQLGIEGEHTQELEKMLTNLSYLKEEEQAERFRKGDYRPGLEIGAGEVLLIGEVPFLERFPVLPDNDPLGLGEYFLSEVVKPGNGFYL